MEFTSHITTNAEAQEYFQAMGCSHFHMSREYPVRYREYQALGISNEQEKAWALEAASELLGQLRGGGGDEEEAWARHTDLVDRILEWKFHELLGPLFDATMAMEPRLSKMDRLLVAETIVGRQEPKYRGGLIFRSHDCGLQELATKFANQACLLVAKPFKATEIEERRMALLGELAEVAGMCGIMLEQQKY